VTPAATAGPDRYGDAVRARRRELRERRALLAPGHRAALRDALLLARSGARTAAAAELAALRREADAHLAGPRPRALVALLPVAAAAVADRAQGSWAHGARAAVRRTAADRGLRLPARWPAVPPLPAARPAPPAPDRPGPVAVLADAGVWRTAALPLVVASLAVAVGATAAGPALLLPAAGAGAGVLVVAVRHRRAATDRARLRRWCGELLDAVAADLDAGLAHAATALAAGAGADLDAAVGRHRAALDAELVLLTTGAGGG
jgi:hypothetical protein